LPRLLSLALMLAGAEWLRGHILTGFPWNVLGYALTWPLPLMQVSGLIGIYGLTIVTIIVLTAPLVLAADRQAGVIGRRWWIAGIVAPALLLVSMAAFGAVRLASSDPPGDPKLMVRIVQPSVVQREKWRPENQERIFKDHIRLSHQNERGEIDGARGIKLIVWPEAAMPFLPLNSPDALEAIGEMLPSGSFLASGALRLDPPNPNVAGSRRRVYNSLLVFGEGGKPVATYDKTHLVPFGEYLPLQRALEAIGLEQLTRLRGGFDTGVVPRPLLRFDGVPPMAPLVCYEAIFPGTVVHGSARPEALLNVTNDGWFGNTTGPRQHLHQARVRAVEEGLPLLRAANNGISAIIDGRGRLLARLDLNAKGAIDSPLPAPLGQPPYGRVGDLPFGLLMIGIATIILRLRRSGVKGWSLL
jgi:apolipoprotein N-acyltransferase